MRSSRRRRQRLSKDGASEALWRAVTPVKVGALILQRGSRCTPRNILQSLCRGLENGQCSIFKEMYNWFWTCDSNKQLALTSMLHSNPQTKIVALAASGNLSAKAEPTAGVWGGLHHHPSLLKTSNLLWDMSHLLGRDKPGTYAVSFLWDASQLSSNNQIVTSWLLGMSLCL